MTRARIAGGVGAIVLIFLAFAAGHRLLRKDSGSAGRPSPQIATADALRAGSHPGFIYGRITTIDGATFEGRLRWGGGEEAFWGDYFNGVRKENPWASYVPPERLPTERRPVEIFGVQFGGREHPINLRRLFMVRFGDLARLEAQGRKVVRVTMKSGTQLDLDRFEAGDFDDGVRVWDAGGRVIDLDTLRIRAIEFLPTPGLAGVPARLHGTVRTKDDEFTGFIQWDREKSTASDLLSGQTAEGKLRVPFDTIRSIARRSDRSLVTLRDGREIEMFGSRDAGQGNRGVYVDDARYGRVLVSWEAFDRIDLAAAGSGPGYDEFPPGQPLSGSVTTRSGERFTGRLVYDLDESETIETLDAPSDGVDYTILFGLVASIVSAESGEADAERVTVTLHGGKVLQLERSGDLGERNAGLLIFGDGREGPEYVRWNEVGRIDFDRPPAMYPPLG
jgi:hypothetical protein